MAGNNIVQVSLLRDWENGATGESHAAGAVVEVNSITANWMKDCGVGVVGQKLANQPIAQHSATAPAAVVVVGATGDI